MIILLGLCIDLLLFKYKMHNYIYQTQEENYEKNYYVIYINGSIC